MHRNTWIGFSDAYAYANASDYLLKVFSYIRWFYLGRAVAINVIFIFFIVSVSFLYDLLLQSSFLVFFYILLYFRILYLHFVIVVFYVCILLLFVFALCFVSIVAGFSSSFSTASYFRQFADLWSMLLRIAYK